ncbi:MAG: FAD-dependent oxidoreductase [Bdellovibrionales bacterium]|jgi:predicted NAD/FAD-binding protein|nr:FAD-dependent oxidoreductase [Bdellovibrionales bacterium]
MKRCAIIGTGIAGMSCAYFLKDTFDVTVFEKNNYVGGHTNTIDVHDGEKTCPMDTGFMVFNEKTYPNLIKLFEKLKVDYVDTDMSFSVRNEDINLEFNGSSVNGLFSQRRNILNYHFLKMIKDILKFNNESIEVLNRSDYERITIGDYINQLGLGDYFFKNFLVPMSSAVWSTPMNKIKDFPAKSLIRFFHNHGFVGVNTQLQWKTVVGGSRQYRDKITEQFKDKIKVSHPVDKIIQKENLVEVISQGQKFEFDKVIVASHADEALKMLENPLPFQEEVLSKFSYQENIAIVHTDEKVMPNLKKNWSSWNFLIKADEAYTVYYMNRLQNVSDKMNFFININGEKFIDKDKVIRKMTYHHPVFDVDAVRAQEKLDELNKDTNLHFTGSYYRYGFHEDALLSSVNLCSSILERQVL